MTEQICHIFLRLLRYTCIMVAMEQQIRQFIQQNNLLTKGDNLVVGVSGGADSVCLLTVLVSLRDEYDIDILVVHVNHGIRDTALRDEDFVKDLCIGNNVRFVSYGIDCISVAKESGLSVEEAGRNERYRLFNEAGNKLYGEDRFKIVVAHHIDDLSETLLFNLARGTGINGLASIKSANANIIRPLLCVTRKEIEDYLRQKGLSFMTDETNESDDYSRNKIRHNVIPVMEEICNNASVHMASTAMQLAEVEDFLSKTTDSKYSVYVIKKENILHISEDVLKEHPAIVRRIIHKALTQTAGRARDISSVQINAVYDLLSMETGKKRNLIYSMTAVRDYDGVCLYAKASEVSHDDFTLTTIRLEIVERNFDEAISTDKYTKWIDYDKITNCPTVRFRQPGDFLYINDEGGRKLLSDYMINEKIPAGQRDLIPLVADGNHILWVVGYRISSKVKVSETTKRILIMTKENKENV